MYLKNRSTKPYEGTFDGCIYAFQPGEVRLIDCETGEFIYRFSMKQVDLIPDPDTGLIIGRRILAKADEKEWNESWDATGVLELVDRSTDDNPLNLGTGGVKTRTTAVPLNKRMAANAGGVSASSAA